MLSLISPNLIMYSATLYWRLLGIALLLIGAASQASAQTPAENTAGAAGATPSVRAFAVESTNRKLSLLSSETFAKYLQIAYSRDLLTKEDGDQGSTYTLKGSLFAIGGIFKGNFNNLSTLQGNYFTRNLNLEAGAKAQGSTKLSDGVFGFTFALINKRDPLFNFAPNEKRMQDLAVKSLSAARLKFFGQATSAEDKLKRQADYRAAAAKDSINGVANQIKFLHDHGLDDVAEYSIEMVTDSLKQGALLTLFGHGNTDFSKNKPITQSDLGIQLLCGLVGSQKRPWDLNIKAFYAWRPDSTLLPDHRNLDRTSFTASFGVNKVLISGTATDKPFLEFSLDAGYERRTGTVYNGQDRDRPYGQAVVRARITDQVWVPLTVQLDLKHGNALGFLNVVWNLTP